MDKTEFLSILREALNQEVNPAVIEQNIRYYDQYISSSSEEEKRKIEELGDPRLIAKTIIEAEKAAREKSGYYDNNNGNSYTGSVHQKQEEDSDWEQRLGRQNSSFHPKAFFANLKWYQKLIAVFAIIILFIIVIFLGRMMIGVLFTFGPILILLLLLGNLFRRRR